MILALALLVGQADAVSRSWNETVEPFHLTAHLSYVGASQVTSFAIETTRGLIVIDGGFAERRFPAGGLRARAGPPEGLSLHRRFTLKAGHGDAPTGTGRALEALRCAPGGALTSIANARASS
jgi:hypothetical protein